MMLSVRLLMHIYQGVLLGWRLDQTFWISALLAVAAQEGLHVNHKQVNRIYHHDGLSVKRRRCRKVLANSRRSKCLTCADAFTKECLTSILAFGILVVQVTRILNSIALFRGHPTTIRTDQGPEFTCRALEQWAFEHGMDLRLIPPGKPTQTGFFESFIGRFRDECLNEHGFSNILHARKTINDWRQDYNKCRPHSSLDYQTLAEFATYWRNMKYEQTPTVITN